MDRSFTSVTVLQFFAFADYKPNLKASTFLQYPALRRFWFRFTLWNIWGVFSFHPYLL